MPTSDLVTIIAWGAMCNVWGVLLWMQRRLRRNGTLVSAKACDRASPTGRVAVVIPARNEEAGIAACLATVQAQDIDDLRIVVVDDRSEDRTGAVLREIAENDPRITVKRVDALPEGWLAKSHALFVGTHGIDAEWFMFLDVDCRLLAPTSIRVAVAEAERREAPMFTVLPALTTGGFAEGLLIPLCSAVMALWYGRSNRPRAAGFANGQFLLVRSDVYHAVGGHAAVRRSVIEDVPFAEAVRAAGYPTWTGGGAELVSVRMYESFKSTFYGWSRIFVGALRSPLKILLSMAWLIAGSLWPFIALPWLLTAWFTHGPTNAPTLAPLTALCLTHLVLLVWVSVGFWGMGRCDRRYLWLYPLSVIGVLAILAHAFWTLTVTRTVGWRTTRYRLDRYARIIVPGAGERV